MAFDPLSAASKPLPPLGWRDSKNPLPFGAVPQDPETLLVSYERPSGFELPRRGESQFRRVASESRTEVQQTQQLPLGLMDPFEQRASYTATCQDSGSLSTGSGKGKELAFDVAYQSTSAFPVRTVPVQEDRFKTIRALSPKVEAGVGSDAWMEKQVAECVDKAEGVLELNHLGLTELSARIVDLKHFTKLKTSSSVAPPFTPGSRPQTPRVSSQSRFGTPSNQENVQPGSSSITASAVARFSSRQFSRVSSAPASSAPLQAFQAVGGREPLQALLQSPKTHFPGSDQRLLSSPAFEDPRTSHVRTFSKGFEPPGSPMLDENFSDRPRSPVNIPASAGRFAQLSLGKSTILPRPKGGPNLLAPSAAIGSPGRDENSSGIRSPGGNNSKRNFRRTASGSMAPVKKEAWSGDSSGDVTILLANNALSTLPSALFQVHNLVALSLRANRLQELPAAIGQLKNLKELNIAHNQLRTLPTTILDLSLDDERFNASLNPWEERTNAARPGNIHPVSGRMLGPCEYLQSPTTSSSWSAGRPVYDTIPSNVAPTLSDTALTVLLSCREPDNLPPLLTAIDWYSDKEGEDCRHGLHDDETLMRRCPFIQEREAGLIIASIRAAADVANSSRHIREGVPNPVFSAAAVQRRLEEARSSTDDAARNPYFYPCPSPRHQVANCPITRQVYLHPPIERRVEWVRVAGVEVPILWQGCKAGCLDFLEHAPPAAAALDDGFDVDLLEESAIEGL